MKSDMEKIIAIAKTVRKASEKLSKNPESNFLDFHGRKDLQCMCAVASFALYKKLKDNGFFPLFVTGKYMHCDHCWVEVNEHIIDITATQFQIIKKVYIVLNDDKRYKPNNKRSKRNSISNLETIQKSGWPKTQAPSWSKVKKYFE